MADNRGIDWLELVTQVALATVGVSILAGASARGDRRDWIPKDCSTMTTRLDKRVLRRSLVASRGRTGRVLPGISKVADRGLVWPLLGAVLTAHRATRGAAAAGLAGVVVSSGLTGVLQLVIQRDRPSRLTALVTRGSVRRPSSASFPSTHAANACAFAAAATTVRPALGLGLVPAAVAIGVARVGIAHHYPSDVLAGAALGASVGVATGVLVRRGHLAAAAARARRTRPANTTPKSFDRAHSRKGLGGT